MAERKDPIKERKLAELLLQAQKGDQSAYETFLSELSKILRPYFARRMQGIDMIEDVLQETLLSIHRSRHTYRSERPLAPWVFAIAQHRLIDFFRKHRTLLRREVSPPEGFEAVAPANEESSSDRGEKVMEVLATLPEKQRNVIQLLKVDGLGVKEVASKLAMSESAIKVTAFRGYETIRKKMGEGK